MTNLADNVRIFQISQLLKTEANSQKYIDNSDVHKCQARKNNTTGPITKDGQYKIIFLEGDKMQIPIPEIEWSLH